MHLWAALPCSSGCLSLCHAPLQIVKFNPSVHCWHVGKYGGPDPDNGFRCCDSGEKCGQEVHNCLPIQYRVDMSGA